MQLIDRENYSLQFLMELERFEMINEQNAVEVNQNQQNGGKRKTRKIKLKRFARKTKRR